MGKKASTKNFICNHRWVDYDCDGIIEWVKNHYDNDGYWICGQCHSTYAGNKKEPWGHPDFIVKRRSPLLDFTTNEFIPGLKFTKKVLKDFKKKLNMNKYYENFRILK